MTTYRRFCCNDLLRLGSLNLRHGTITDSMLIYMGHLAMWPGNCHVAVVWGGQIAGYIFGDIVDEGAHCTGQLSMIALPSMELLGLGRKLSNLLEDCCDKTYNAYTMRIFLPLNASFSRSTMNKGQKVSILEAEAKKVTGYVNCLVTKLGYQLFKVHEDYLELRKPLARLMEPLAPIMELADE